MRYLIFDTKINKEYTVPTLQKYTQLSNDAHNEADSLQFSAFMPEDIPTRVGDNGSSLQTREAKKLHLRVKRTHSVTGHIATASHLLGCESLRSSAGRDFCVVAGYAGFATTANSEARGRPMLGDRQLNAHGIEPVVPEVNMSFGPSKVAKIKADAGVRPMSGLGVRAATAILMIAQHQFPRSATANDNYERIAA